MTDQLVRDKERVDDLQNGYYVIQDPEKFCFGMDAVLLSGFAKVKKGDEVVPRLLALYNQDENRVKTASYTLTAPKATFKQDGSRIKGGTFKGDVYVECNNFELVDATVDGNIYFKTQEAKDSFKLDNTSKVTGNVEVK